MIERSLFKNTVTVAVAALFAVTVSAFVGKLMLAVLLNVVPVGVDDANLTTHVAVYRSEPPTGNVAIDSEMLPLPLAAGHRAPPPVSVHVHEHDDNGVGNVSETTLFGAPNGPLLPTSMVKTTGAS